MFDDDTSAVVGEEAYVLLERLFKFLESDEDLNPVLSGYFCKLVTLLINRKQKQVIPYVFSEGSTIIDRLLHHVYQKSISELLNKLLTVADNEYDSDVVARIKSKQNEVVSKLIQKLSPEHSEEDNLNGCSILYDLLETKQFFNVACSQENVELLIGYATNPQATIPSRANSCIILYALCINTHKKNDEVNLNSDDEEITTQTEAESSPLVAALKDNLQKFSESLATSSEENKLQTSIDNQEIVPLGQVKLRTVELLVQVLKLHQEPLTEAVLESDLMLRLSDLLETHPWNNFL